MLRIYVSDKTNLLEKTFAEMRSMFLNDDSLEVPRSGLFDDKLSMTSEEANRLNALLQWDDELQS